MSKNNVSSHHLELLAFPQNAYYNCYVCPSVRTKQVENRRKHLIHFYTKELSGNM
jgi:hypothetical protein